MRKFIAPLMLLSTMAISPLAFSQSQTVVTVVANTQATYYNKAEGLRVRSAPEANAKTLGLLDKNDRVRLINTDLINGKFIQVEILKTANTIISSEKYFVAFEFLSDKPADNREFNGKYFVVVNVATETLRLYERTCMDNSCPNKMLLETEVVVGEDADLKKEETGKGRSILGSFRITRWGKFYQDGAAHYPSWYKEGYPDVPEAGAGFNKWFRPKIMPKDENGETHGVMRGAFGWYTAFVGPFAYNQWTHGTVGWGEDKDEYIKKTKKIIPNIITDPRSSGCTRTNNEAIAYIRQLVEAGAPIIKIYAKEAILDKKLTNYPRATAQWNYILTKRADLKADRDEVLKTLGVTGYEADAYFRAKRAGAKTVIDPTSPLNEILEVGTFTMDTMPTVIPYVPGEKLGKFERSIGRKGNVYGVHSKAMSYGVYYVDAGFLDGYHHPTEILEVGGFEGEETPPWMDINNLDK